MNGKNKKKKLLVSQTLIYFVPAFVLISILVWSFYFHSKTLWFKDIDQNLKTHVEREKIEINGYLRTALNDLTFLNERTQLFDLFNESDQELTQKLEQEYAVFIENHSLYQQIRFIDKLGNEVVRVDNNNNNNNNQTIICPRENLQNKKDRYYFQESIHLEKNQVYISPLDLNVEYGEIEIPFNPMLRFASPVFDKNGTKKGIVVLNYRSNTFLSKLENHLESGIKEKIQSQMLNSDGFWLHHKNPDICWGFMIDDRHDLQMTKTKPELWQTINSSESGEVSDNNCRYSFETIYPVNVSLNEANREKIEIKLPTQKSDYYWKILSYLPGHVIASYRQKHVIITWTIYTLLIITFFCVSLLLAKYNLQKKAAETKFKALYEESREAIFILDGISIVSGNPAAIKIFGFNNEEELKQSNPVELSPEYQPDGQKTTVKAQRMLELTHTKGSHFFEWKHALKNGKEFDATVLLNTIDINGKKLVQATIRDISEQKFIEKMVEQKQHNLESIFKSAPVGMLLVNEQTEVTHINEAAIKISNKDFSELMFQQPGEVICCSNKNKHEQGCGHSNECKLCPIRNAIAQTFQTQKPVQLSEVKSVIEINGKSQNKYFELNTDFVEINDKAHVLIALNDITKRKETEKKLLEAQEKLIETAHKAGMAEVAADVLHNVGNVLNSINVTTTLITKQVTNSEIANLGKLADIISNHTNDIGKFISEDPKGKHVPAFLTEVSKCLINEQNYIIDKLHVLTKNIEHIKEIVSTQQSYARISAVEVQTNIPQLIEDAIYINSAALERHNTTIIRKFDDLPDVQTNKQKILQILVNLINNAKYAVTNNGKNNKEITIKLYQYENDWFRIEVTDNGIGISSEHLTKIFNHGFTTKVEGHGFGLHSGALAAKEMGGSLTVHSEGPGQGATFIIELPFKPVGITK